jgi:hypothetical protein
LIFEKAIAFVHLTQNFAPPIFPNPAITATRLSFFPIL